MRLKIERGRDHWSVEVSREYGQDRRYGWSLHRFLVIALWRAWKRCRPQNGEGT